MSLNASNLFALRCFQKNDWPESLKGDATWGWQFMWFLHLRTPYYPNVLYFFV